AVPEYLELELVARLLRRDRVPQLLELAHGRAVDCGYDVTAEGIALAAHHDRRLPDPDAALVGAASRVDALDEQAFARQLEELRELCCYRHRADAEEGMRDLAGRDDLCSDVAHRVHGHREADADVALLAVARVDL